MTISHPSIRSSMLLTRQIDQVASRLYCELFTVRQLAMITVIAQVSCAFSSVLQCSVASCS